MPDQDPDLDATAARREQPLFGGAAAKSDKVRAAALGTNDDGVVSLDIGRASGLGVGSEFTSTRPTARDRTFNFASPAWMASRAPRPKSSARRARRLLPAISSS